MIADRYVLSAFLMVLTDLKNNNSGWFRHYSPEPEWKKIPKNTNQNFTIRDSEQIHTAEHFNWIPLLVCVDAVRLSNAARLARALPSHGVNTEKAPKKKIKKNVLQKCS